MLKPSFLIKLAPFWILSLLIGSLLPQEAKIALGTSTPDGQVTTRLIVWTHRLVHYAAFGSTTLLLVLAARKPWQRHVGLLLTIGLGIGIETLQCLWYGSDFETRDVRDDVIAACVVYLTWHAVRLWQLTEALPSKPRYRSLKFAP